MEDSLDVPDFLVRKPGTTCKSAWPTPKTNPWKWVMTQAMRDAIEKGKITEQRAEDCKTVLLAVLAGHSTVGQIRKASGMETKPVQRALKTLRKCRSVAKIGRQYVPF